MSIEKLPKVKHTSSNNFFLLAGPCAIEGEEMALRIAERVVKITDDLKIPYVFKGSFKRNLLSKQPSLFLFDLYRLLHYLKFENKSN